MDEVNGNQVVDQSGNEVVEALKADPKVEERARIQGWVPKEEFKGDSARWIPADEFVKRADHMMPILKSVNRKLETQVGEMSKKLAETQDLMQKMVKINSKYIDDSYDSKIAEIRGEMRKAVESGDTARYDQLLIQESKLTKPEKIEIKPEENAVNNQHPEAVRFEEENKSWFGVDPEMTEYAYFVGEQLKNMKSPLAMPGKQKEFFEEVTRKIRATFPAKFVNPNRNRSDLDESNIRGSDNQGNGGKKSWSDLPDEAKRQANKLISEVPGYTKEKYLKDYFEA